jgi:hypothetical protein
MRIQVCTTQTLYKKYHMKRNQFIQQNKATGNYNNEEFLSGSPMNILTFLTK